MSMQMHFVLRSTAFFKTNRFPGTPDESERTFRRKEEHDEQPSSSKTSREDTGADSSLTSKGRRYCAVRVYGSYNVGFGRDAPSSSC